MVKILFVIPPHNFRDIEYFEPKNVLERAGYKVITTSNVIDEVSGIESGKADVEIHSRDVNVVDYDGIVFVGGVGMIEFISDFDFIHLAKEFYEHGKIVAAICSAVGILAKAGILRGKRATGWQGISEIIEAAGGEYSPNQIEISGNIITAHGPEAVKDFAEALQRAFTNLRLSNQ